MPRRPHLRLLALAALLLGLAAGCGGTPTDAATRTACGPFLDHLPDRLADQRRVGVDPSALSATYGKPAITVTCGTIKPEALRATSQCQRVDGVDWFAPPDQIGQTPIATTLTTIGRRPRIQIAVPKDYWPPTAAMVDLGPDVKAHLARTTGCS